jgi:hypothetical protein
MLAAIAELAGAVTATFQPTAETEPKLYDAAELTFRRSRMQFGMNFPGLFLRVERLLWDTEQCE